MSTHTDTHHARTQHAHTLTHHTQRTNNPHNSNLAHEEDEGDNPVFYHHFLNVGKKETHDRASRLEEAVAVDGRL